jgi:hypothetical protein
MANIEGCITLLAKIILSAPSSKLSVAFPGAGAFAHRPTDAVNNRHDKPAMMAPAVILIVPSLLLDAEMASKYIPIARKFNCLSAAFKLKTGKIERQGRRMNAEGRSKEGGRDSLPDIGLLNCLLNILPPCL